MENIIERNLTESPTQGEPVLTHEKNQEEGLTQSQIEALKEFRIRKLKHPSIAALFQFARRDPEVSEYLDLMSQNRHEFTSVTTHLDKHDSKNKEDDVIDEDKRIHLLRFMWAALATYPSMAQLMKISIDSASTQESVSIKKEIMEGNNYVHELVVGAGVHGSVYNAQAVHDLPQLSRLTVDAASSLGGQFQSYGNPAFRMNSPNRAINKDIEDSIENMKANPLGPEAPIQVTDISGDLFANNATMGLAVAINQYMSSDTLLGTSVESVKQNTNTDQPGKYEVKLRDIESDEEYSVFTDRIIFSTGIGRATYGLNNIDLETQEVLEDQAKLIEEQKPPTVLTYTEFLKEIGDSTNRFPLQRFVNKKICIVGGGHSALTVAEFLTGLGPEYRGSVSSLGSPKEIYLMGSKYETGEKFQGLEFARYTQLAATYGKDVVKGVTEQSEQHNLIITPVQCRAKGLTYITSEDSEDKRILVRGSRKSSNEAVEIDADIVIFTTGFENNLTNILKDILPPDETKSEEEILVDNFTIVADEETNIPAGRCVSYDGDIVLVGPAANIPLAEAQIKHSLKYNLPTNPIALANTTYSTISCSKIISRQWSSKFSEGTSLSHEKLLRHKSPERKVLPNTNEETENIISKELPENVSTGEMAFGVEYDDALRLAILSTMQEFTLPVSINKLSIDVTRKSHNQFNFELSPALPPEYSRILERLTSNEMFLKTVSKLTKRSPELSITIPLQHRLEQTRHIEV